MSEWISVKDRLPEIEAFVLFCVLYSDPEDQVMHYGWFSGRNWRTSYTTAFNADDEYVKITHWMPLPDKPKL